MLAEAVALLPTGRVDHLIRSLVLVDRTSADIRLSYWKLLPKDDDACKVVIGFELVCLYDERMHLEVSDSSHSLTHSLGFIDTPSTTWKLQVLVQCHWH